MRADSLTTKQRALYRVIYYGLRVYVASLLVAGLYSILWLAAVAGSLEQSTIGAIWLAI